MASDKQIEANRLNAARSTGPRTVEGKRRASQNALKHGLLQSRFIALPHEDPAYWDRFTGELYASYAPVGAQEARIVARVCHHQAMLERISRIEAGLLSFDPHEKKEKEPFDRFDEPLRQLCDFQAQIEMVIKSIPEIGEDAAGTLVMSMVKRRGWLIKLAAELWNRAPSPPEGHPTRERVAKKTVSDIEDLDHGNAQVASGGAVNWRAGESGWPDESLRHAYQLQKKLEDVARSVSRLGPKYETEAIALKDILERRGRVIEVAAELRRRKTSSRAKDPRARNAETSRGQDAELVGGDCSEEVSKPIKVVSVAVDRRETLELMSKFSINSSELEKLMRYRARTENSYFRDLHELERLKARREGRPLIPPVVLDVSSDSPK